MLRRLKIYNGIKHHDLSIEFDKGLTAIVGPNGCGKSLLAEFIAFALFGTVALRGKAADYPKNLKVLLEVDLKGRHYLIARTLKDCQIERNDNGAIGLICEGTKPCNTFVINELGYNYTVYKMGNYAEQVDILGLGKMKPAERKQAMDMVLGLSSIDKLIKVAKEKELKYKSEAEGIALVLGTEPEKPEQPEGFDAKDTWKEKSNLLAQSIKDVEEAQHTINLLGELKEPEEVKNESDPIELDHLKTLQQSRILHKSRIIGDIGLNTSVYNIEELKQQIVDYKLYQTYLAQIAQFDNKGVVPEHELETLKELEEAQNKWELFSKSKITCPSCAHEFSLNVETVEEPKIVYPKEYFKAQYKLYDNLEQLALIPEVAPVLVPEFTYEQLSDIEKHNESVKWLGENPQDFEHMIFEMQKNELEYKKYLEEKNHYDSNKLILAGAHYVLKNNGTKEELLEQYSEIFAMLEKFKVYETLLSVYNNQLEIWVKNKSTYEKLLYEKERYQLAGKGLTEIKTKIKTLVIPSLSTVAGKLLSEMSEGLYSNLKVTEDFEVTVDEKDVGLFSGSEQAMINLALRLALGQVLTHKSLSVFIGDEIDASMRDERAQLTSDCLRRVCAYIKQIMIISHRDVEADNYIELTGE